VPFQLPNLGQPLALGENPTVGAWRGANINGGTALAIIHMSFGMSPFFPVSEWHALFGGLQIFAGTMVVSGDIADSSTFGAAVAAGYVANSGSSPAYTYAAAISSVSDGSGCNGGTSYHGGFNGCGCHVAFTFSSSAANAQTVLNEQWSALLNDSVYQTSAGYGAWYMQCNYNTSQYPIELGGY
jgi:hypothetical protein